MPNLSPADQEAMTPAEALERLREGNARFVGGKLRARDHAAAVAHGREGQWPFAVILGCIDSRVPVELVFDQGVGHLFTARVAGNVVNDDVLGSMEFACKLAGAKLVVVLGHTRCGAVKGACDGAELGHLSTLLGRIQPAVAAVREREGKPDARSDDAAFVDAVGEENVRRAVADVRERSPVLAELVDAGRLGLVGAVYDVASGRVTFLD